MKIYVYNIPPTGFAHIKDFVSYAIKDIRYNKRETYKSWLYFMNYLFKSPFYTEDPDKAQLYLVPQYENYFAGADPNHQRSYYNHLVKPLITAIDSSIYKNSTGRNHLFIYISDDTPLFDVRIPFEIRQELERRFIRLTYSGRICSFGQYHLSNQSISIFNYDHSQEIVVPPATPIEYYTKRAPKNICKDNFLYKGTLTPDAALTERCNTLVYFKDHVTDNEDSYFGVHCAGWGIWTARLYNYLNIGLIPIIMSDGVILPFERFFNYEAFTVKLLSTTYNSQKKEPIQYLKNVCDEMRAGLDTENTRRLKQMQSNVLSMSDWLDWKSKIAYKNPFVLTIIELYDYIKLSTEMTGSYSRVAKEEYYDLNAAGLSLYRVVKNDDL